MFFVFSMHLFPVLHLQTSRRWEFEPPLQGLYLLDLKLFTLFFAFFFSFSKTQIIVFYLSTTTIWRLEEHAVTWKQQSPCYPQIHM